ncbi:hypothetical protein G9A89_003857 [Geosiphon pyriformis]|nr:hypothetical protein G9A89_003857 [Geosiphon pyriformis]
MSKKKTPKSALYGPVDRTFSQKKKISVSNIKHSGDEKKISLTKLNINENIYSDMNSEFNNNKLGSTELSSGGASFLGLAVTTPKAKKVIIDLVGGFSIVVKTQVEVLIKKSFALDINLSAVKRKSVTAKTQFIRKFFSLVNGFGGEMIVTALTEFGKIKSIKIQLIELWQKAMVEFAEIGQTIQLAAK